MSADAIKELRESIASLRETVLGITSGILGHIATTQAAQEARLVSAILALKSDLADTRRELNRLAFRVSAGGAESGNPGSATAPD